MILANFDLSFFTSIPGMLITGGVLLLLIALIIFIATGSKKGSKKNKKDKNNVDPNATEGTIDTNIGDSGVVNTVDVPNTNEVNPTVVPSTPAVEPSVVAPQSTNDNINVVSEEQVQPNVDNPTVSPVESTVTAPTNDVVTPDVVQTPNPTPIVDTNNSVNNVVTPDTVINPINDNNAASLSFDVSSIKLFIRHNLSSSMTFSKKSNKSI